VNDSNDSQRALNLEEKQHEGAQQSADAVTEISLEDLECVAGGGDGTAVTVGDK
jgi:hypothetical protein